MNPWPMLITKPLILISVAGGEDGEDDMATLIIAFLSVTEVLNSEVYV